MITLIGMITLIRVLLWASAISRCSHARATLAIPLVEHDQLGGEYTQNVLTYNEAPPPYSTD